MKLSDLEDLILPDEKARRIFVIDRTDVTYTSRYGDEVVASFAEAVHWPAKTVVTLNEDCAPEDMWWLQGVTDRSFDVVLLSKPRSAKELFRVLSLAERFVAPGGSIFIMPYAPPGQVTAENRAEATELFLGLYQNYDRTLRQGHIVQLKSERGEISFTAVEPTQKRVISLSVFGDGGYWQYLEPYAMAHKALFPGYELWVHYDGSHEGSLENLQRQGLIHRLVMIPRRAGQGKCERMLHRLMPAWDPEVGYVFARDVDALPTWRERCAVEEFITTGLDAHTICDNIAHSGLMGGLCGFNAEALRKAMKLTFDEFIKAAGFSDERWAQHGADQDYLNSRVAPKVSVFEHSVFNTTGEDGKTRFLRKQPTIPGAKMVYEIAPFDDERVAAVVKEKSDSFIGYMGTAGYDHTKATAFYKEVTP